ncbi:apolipoprotein N-acyltransferase [Knoellia remsis]|nr:apolipoprotein N-acyltransferase [Knoellia remsis]
MRVPPRSFPYAVRALLAVVAGLALWLAFPEYNLWWLAPVGVALLGGATWGAGGRGGFGLGFVAGLAFFVPVISWSGIFVGKLPWFALATLEALYFGAMGAVVGYVSQRLGSRQPADTTGEKLTQLNARDTSPAFNWVSFSRAANAPDRRSPRPHTAYPLSARTAYLLIPLAWVAQELARGTTPFGGFPWARLAFSQADSPMAYVARYLGAPGVTAAVALVGTALLVTVVQLRRGSRAGVLHLAAAVVAVALVGVTLVPPTDGRQVTIGLVQGNTPRAGLDFNAERRAVLDNHVRGTEAIGANKPDDLSLVIWPENSSDIDPLRNPDAAAQVQRALGAVGVPLLIGAVLQEPGSNLSNASLLYRPGADGAAPERYIKNHPVPFAEYIPYRSFFRRFSDKVDYVTRDFVAGTELGAFRVDAPGGAFWALPTICFEVAYDQLMRDSVGQPGAEASLLVVQTNNATFGYTAESEQQFAISRIRAIEHGRSVAHVSTVGVSGIIAPDGSVSSKKTGLFTAEQIVDTATIRTETTVSDRLGPWPERVAVAVLVLLVAYAAWRGRRDRRLRRRRTT